jgi:hypothetical protein
MGCQGARFEAGCSDLGDALLLDPAQRALLPVDNRRGVSRQSARAFLL